MTSLPDLWQPHEREVFAGPALIDTHIWIWYLDGAETLMALDAIRLLKRCVRGHGLLVSDISVWEIGTKASKGKLTLLPSLSAWLEQAGRRPGFTFLPLDREILLRSTQLPGTVHGDPADRILIASARLANLPLVTADRAIIDYVRGEGGFSVCDARP
jgi:PIN domain nuclease of toxin-antitoxin system